MHKSIAALAASCLALCVFAAPGLAHTTSSSTSVTIGVVAQAGGDLFRGKVSSPDPRCVNRRLVRLFRVAPGADPVLDTDRSEDNGSWDIDVEGGAAPGRYYVRVVARTATAPGHSHTCRAAMSRLITVS
jgi:hypothetical protein